MMITEVKDNKNTVADKKRKVFEIKNKFVNNNTTTELYKPIDGSAITELIRIKTQNYQDTASRSKTALVKKIEAILMKEIPATLKVAFRKYNHCFIKHPGFIYQTSHHYGSLKVLVEPNIPYYFEQFTEMDMILKYALFQRDKLDSHVEMYHRYTQKLLKKEAGLAVQLNGIKRLIDLLEYDVEYYLMYIDIIEAFKHLKTN